MSFDVDLVRACAFGMIVVNLSSVHMYLGPARLLRPGLTLLLLPALAVLLKPSLARWRNLRETAPPKIVAGLFLLVLGSGLFGLSLGTTVALLRKVYLLNLVFFLLVIVSIRNIRDLTLFLWAYVIGIGIVVVLAQTVFETNITHDGLARLGGGRGMYDANDLGMIALIALPLAVLFMYCGGALVRIISLVTMIGIPVTIALTGSRGAMVGLVFVGLGLLVSLRRIPLVKRLVGGVVIFFAISFAAPQGYWQQMETILDPSDDYNVASDYGRWPLMQRGIGYMLSYPVFGVGAGNFARAEGTISPIIQSRLARGMSVEWIAPHNTYVQVGAELGVFGLILWLTLLYQGTVGLWKLRKSLPEGWESDTPERKIMREICLFLPLSFVAFAVTSVFLSHAYTTPAYMLFAFLAGTRLAVAQELRKDGTPSPGRARATTRRRRPTVLQGPSTVVTWS